MSHEESTFVGPVEEISSNLDECFVSEFVSVDFSPMKQKQ